MKTAISTGPGFFAADTSPHDVTLPEDTMRVYCIRLEAYDLPLSSDSSDLSFSLIFAMSEDDPRIAKALLKLGKAIEDNRAALEEEAAKVRSER